MKQKEEFIQLFFNPDEEVCVSPNKYAFQSITQKELFSGQFLLTSPNEKVEPYFASEVDVNLIAINPIAGFRNDANVTAFRSFLVEIDTGSLAEQKKYIEETGLPYSVCIFSGNKSLHYGIVLDEPMFDIVSWRFINKWILNIISKADQQTQNPSRCIRYPNNIRHDGKGLPQSLIEMKGRVESERLYLWLNKYPEFKPKVQERVRSAGIGIATAFAKIPKWVDDALKEGVTNLRNNTWFKIAQEFAKVGVDINDTISVLEPHLIEFSDFKRKEWIGAIESGYKRIFGGMA